MKSRNTIILLVVCIGLFGYFQLFHKKQLTTDQIEERRGKPVKLDRDKINAITLRNGESTFEFVKRDGNWFLEAPVKDRAESDTVAALFTSAEGINWSTVQGITDEKQAMKDFGIEKGEVSIKFTGEKGMDAYNEGATSVEILAGKDSAIEGRVYFRIANSGTAYIGSKDLRDNAAKGIKDWRSRALSDMNASQVNKVHLKTAKGEIEAERKGGHWSILKPFKARGDNQQITDMISNVLTARIEEFITDNKDLGAFGLAEPRATLTLHAEDAKEPVVLQIGSQKVEKKDEPKKEETAEAKPEKKDDQKDAPPPATHVYVKLSSRDGVVTVPVAIESLLTKQPNDLRDQSLMRVQSDIVDRITIEAPGKEKIVLARSGEEWVRKQDGKNDEPANGGAANKLLNTLVNAKVARFVEDTASDLKKFGLDTPLAVTLSSYSTEGTPETKPGDKPIVKLLLGKFEGEAGYAKLDDEPFIVAVDKLLIQDVWSDPIQWHDLKVLDLKKDDIASIEVTRAGQQPVTLEKDGEKGWKLAKGDATVNQAAVGSMLNTISALRAVRWIGPTDKAEHGIESPNIVISYTLADKKTGKLIVGKNTADEMWHAVIEGRQGTFLLNKLDFDALNAALLETPKAAAADSTTPAVAGKREPVTATTPPVTVPAPTGEASPAPPPPAPDPAPSPEPPKPTETPAGDAKPAPDAAPKPQ